MNKTILESLIWHCFRDKRVECFMLFGFNNSELIHVHEHSRGNERECQVNINHVLSFCIRHKIDELLVAHNHIYSTKDWSFKIKSSEADKKTISKLKRVLNNNNIKLGASYISTSKNIICHLEDDRI